MAKSKSFFGLRKGSTKTMTFSVLKGQQITKDRVTDVANPRTYSQMVQRMIFAQAVKFYKHAQQNFFKFAFESKKPLESDYNAFVRINAKKGIAVSRKAYENNNYPSIGLYQLSEGSLQDAQVKWNSANSAIDFIAAVTSGATTIAALSKGILATYSGIQEGDIVTLVQIASNVNQQTSELVDGEQTIWNTVQFVINTSDQTLITEALGEDFFCISGALSWPALRVERPSACAVIFSRKTPYGLKVSNSVLVPNKLAADWITINSTAIVKKTMATTWGANDSAILEGALVKEQDTPRPVPPAPSFVMEGGRTLDLSTSHKSAVVTFTPNVTLDEDTTVKINGVEFEQGPPFTWGGPWGEFVFNEDSASCYILATSSGSHTVETIEINGVLYV